MTFAGAGYDAKCERYWVFASDFRHTLNDIPQGGVRHIHVAILCC